MPDYTFTIDPKTDYAGYIGDDLEKYGFDQDDLSEVIYEMRFSTNIARATIVKNSPTAGMESLEISLITGPEGPISPHKISSANDLQTILITLGIPKKTCAT